MTQEQILEGNKIIDESEFGQGKMVYQNCPIHLLKYDSSWEWIMPVVIDINKKVQKKENFQLMMGMFMKIQKALLQLDITKLFIAVIEFIKYYNTQAK